MRNGHQFNSKSKKYILRNAFLLVVLLSLVAIVAGCGGSNSNTSLKYKAELTAKIVINGVGPGNWELLVYEQGRVGDKLYLVAKEPIVYEDYAETKPEVIGSFKAPIPEPGMYDIELKNSAGVQESWRDYRIDAPNTDLGTFHFDYPTGTPYE